MLAFENHCTGEQKPSSMARTGSGAAKAHPSSRTSFHVGKKARRTLATPGSPHPPLSWKPMGRSAWKDSRNIGTCGREGGGEGAACLAAVQAPGWLGSQQPPTVALASVAGASSFPGSH